MGKAGKSAKAAGFGGAAPPPGARAAASMDAHDAETAAKALSDQALAQLTETAARDLHAEIAAELKAFGYQMENVTKFNVENLPSGAHAFYREWQQQIGLSTAAAQAVVALRWAKVPPASEFVEFGGHLRGTTPQASAYIRLLQDYSTMAHETFHSVQASGRLYNDRNKFYKMLEESVTEISARRFTTKFAKRKGLPDSIRETIDFRGAYQRPVETFRKIAREAGHDPNKLAARIKKTAAFDQEITMDRIIAPRLNGGPGRPIKYSDKPRSAYQREVRRWKQVKKELADSE